MPKGSGDLGLNLPIPGRDFSMVKPSVSFTDIDTDGDVAAQIAACDEALVAVVDAAEKRLEQTTADLTGLDFEGLGFGAWKTGFFKTWSTSIVNEMKRLGGLIDGTPAEGAAKKPRRG